MSSDRILIYFWCPLLAILLLIGIWLRAPEWERMTDGPLADWLWAAGVCAR
jgi:hypothetical protein